MSLLNRDLYIIAEVANAAQGNVDTYHRIIDEVSRTGADGIKFQFYKYDELATPYHRKYDIFRRTFFTQDEFTGFVKRADKAGLDILVDVFDRWGLQVAKKNLDKIEAVKIPPTVIVDDELVQQILNLGKPTIIGVGGYEDEDIDLVLSKVRARTNPILLLYGFQGFPTKEEDTCLKRIAYLKQKYGYAVGFADHIDGGADLALRLPEYAFFAGATVIEKHITLDRAAQGLDYYSALEPSEFRQMVKKLRRCVAIYGTERITQMQKNYLKDAVRVTTTREIKAGELVFRKDINFRRTDEDKALFPNQADELFPAVALHNLRRDAGVTRSDVRKATVGTIVVCRVQSKRLPRKALVDIAGVPAIERCLLNALASKQSPKVILATSTHPDDAVLESHTLNGKVHFFQGSENDLAARFIEAAEKFGIDIIIRVTGDSPLISYELIDLLVDAHIKAGADFSYFTDAPLGTTPEVVNKPALIRLKSLISTDKYSEYLSLYFKNNPNFFKLNEVVPPKVYQCPNYRLNLDWPEDIEVLNTIFEKLGIGQEAVALQPVLKFLKRHPEIAAINNFLKPKYKQGEFAEFLNRVTQIPADRLHTITP